MSLMQYTIVFLQGEYPEANTDTYINKGMPLSSAKDNLGKSFTFSRSESCFLMSMRAVVSQGSYSYLFSSLYQLIFLSW